MKTLPAVVAACLLTIGVGSAHRPVTSVSLRGSAALRRVPSSKAGIRTTSWFRRIWPRLATSPRLWRAAQLWLLPPARPPPLRVPRLLSAALRDVGVRGRV